MCIQCLSNVYWYLSNGNTNLAASSWKLHVQQRSRFPKAVLRRQRRVAGASQEHRLPACLAAGDWGLTMKNLWKDPGQLWKNIYIRKIYIYMGFSGMKKIAEKTPWVLGEWATSAGVTPCWRPALRPRHLCRRGLTGLSHSSGSTAAKFKG
jgi:hypothetical protein